MSVRLTIWQYPWTDDPAKTSYKHAIYNPLISRMTSEPGYMEWNNFRRRDYLNNMLSVYNGGLVQFNSMKVQFEFESEDDLTQFVLAWS